MEITLFTATWNYNLGDELILLQEYNLLKKKFWENTIFNIFTYDQESSLIKDIRNIRYISYFPKNIKKQPIVNVKYLFKTIKTIYKSEAIIIWWGWLIYDSEVQKASSPIWQWKLRIFLSKIFLKKIYWLSIWINTKKPKKIKYLFSWKKTKVSVRDSWSFKLLESIWIKSEVLDDPVFLKDSFKWKKTKKEKIIWISLRRWYLKREQENIKQILLYLTRKGYKLILLSHSIHQKDVLADDYIFLRSFALKYNIEITKDIKTTLKSYEKLDYVIWMRFHSVILSIINNIPFLSLNYSKKSEELIWAIKYKYQISCNDFEFDKFVKKFEDLEKDYKGVKFALNKKCDKIKKDLILKYNIFFDGLEKNKR